MGGSAYSTCSAVAPTIPGRARALEVRSREEGSSRTRPREGMPLPTGRGVGFSAGSDFGIHANAHGKPCPERAKSRGTRPERAEKRVAPHGTTDPAIPHDYSVCGVILSLLSWGSGSGEAVPLQLVGSSWTSGSRSASPCPRPQRDPPGRGYGLGACCAGLRMRTSLNGWVPGGNRMPIRSA